MLKYIVGTSGRQLINVVVPDGEKAINGYHGLQKNIHFLLVVVPDGDYILPYRELYGKTGKSN